MKTSHISPFTAPLLLLSLLALPGLSAGQDQRAPQQDDPPSENVTRAFDAADRDGNGLLSIEEARAALPDLAIEDSNQDGWFNHAEAEQAVPDLNIRIGDSARNAVVGESDYLAIRLRVNGPGAA